MITTPKITLAKETVLLAPFGGNRKVNNVADKHLELLIMVIITKLTPLMIPKLVRNIPKKTKKAVKITILSNNIVLKVKASLLCPDFVF